VYRIRRVYTVLRRDFALTATVTRVEVADPDPLLASFDLRQTRAYVQSEPLSLRPRLAFAVMAAVGVLRAELLTLGSRRKVIVMGRTLPEAFSGISEPANVLGRRLGRLRDQLSAVNPGSEVTVHFWLGAQAGRLPDVQEKMPASRLQTLLSALIAQAQSGNASGVAQAPEEGASGAGKLAAALTSSTLWDSSLQVTLAIEVAGDLTGMTLF